MKKVTTRALMCAFAASICCFGPLVSSASAARIEHKALGVSFDTEKLTLQQLKHWHAILGSYSGDKNFSASQSERLADRIATASQAKQYLRRENLTGVAGVRGLAIPELGIRLDIDALNTAQLATWDNLAELLVGIAQDAKTGTALRAAIASRLDALASAAAGDTGVAAPAAAAESSVAASSVGKRKRRTRTRSGGAALREIPVALATSFSSADTGLTNVIEDIELVETQPPRDLVEWLADQMLNPEAEKRTRRE